MPRGRTKKPKSEQRLKKVNVKLIERKDAWPYKVIKSLIDEHHGHLAGAKIAVFWRFGWKANVDGNCRLGQVVKGGDILREASEFDFVLLLNHEALNQGSVPESKQVALMDHLLCHCEVSRDRNGEPVTDENKRTVYRMRNPDVREFKEIIKRRGAWTSDLHDFLEAASEAAKRPLLTEQILAEDKEQAAKNKAESNGHHGGVNRVKGMLPGKDASSNGHAGKEAANPLDELRAPKRIKLTEAIAGHPKLRARTGHDVVRSGPGGGVMIKGKAGKLVAVTPYQYVIVV
jgi:hypothetical protein